MCTWLGRCLAIFIIISMLLWLTPTRVFFIMAVFMTLASRHLSPMDALAAHSFNFNTFLLALSRQLFIVVQRIITSSNCFPWFFKSKGGNYAAPNFMCFLQRVAVKMFPLSYEPWYSFFLLRPSSSVAQFNITKVNWKISTTSIRAPHFVYTIRM